MDTIELIKGSVFKEPEKAFDDAIFNGLLSADKNEENFAGNYMYMYTRGEKDFFKNHLTREYIYA